MEVAHVRQRLDPAPLASDGDRWRQMATVGDSDRHGVADASGVGDVCARFRDRPPPRVAVPVANGKGHLPGLLWPQVLLPGGRGVKKGVEEEQRWKVEKRIRNYCYQGATEVRVGGKSDLRLGSVKRAGLAFLLQLSGGLQEEHHHHPHLQGQP